MSLFKQSTGNSILSSTAGVGITGTFGSNTTPGSTIIVVSIEDSSTDNLTISDSEGNTYIAINSAASVNTGNAAVFTWYAKKIKGGTANVITVKEAGGGRAIAFEASEYTGLSDGNPFLERTKTAIGGSGVPSSGASLVTSMPIQLVIGVMASTSDVTETAGAGYGNLGTQHVLGASVAIEDKSITTTGAQTAAFGVADTNWFCACYTFVDASNASNAIVSSKLRPHPFSPGLAR